MTVLITLVLPPGGDAGPFNLYSNTDGYITPFETNISAAALIAGYTALFVPDGTTTIRVKSVGICTNFIDVPVNVLPTTTTTSSSSTSSTTTTSTTAGPTTTTTSSSSTSTSTSTSSSTTTTTTTDEPTTTTTTTTISCVSGDLSLTNDTVAGIIDDVYVAFGIWFIATATPVGPGITAVGAQGGTNDPISVDVTVSQVSCISLYVNCVKIESIEVPSTGTYTFAATNILNADAVTIILTETGVCV